MSSYRFETLDNQLSEPSDTLVENLAATAGDILLLGAGGKMGTTLSLMAHKALAQVAPERKVYAASRFRDASKARALEAAGVVAKAGDLFDDGFLRQLPDCGDVGYQRLPARETVPAISPQSYRGVFHGKRLPLCER